MNTPELTGRENIYLNGAILGMGRKEIAQKFDEIVDFAGVEKFIDTPIKRYSSGMNVRLAFAVAAQLEPEILVVDDVLAVGDASFQKKCLGKMGEVAQEGRTVLFVSHNMGMIRKLCPITLLLSRGGIEFIGATEETVNYYTNANWQGTRITDDLSSYVDCQTLDHSGTSEAKINWAEIRNSQGNRTLDIFMNEEFQIYNGIENPLNYALTYAIGIVDLQDYPLFHLWSEYEEIDGENNQDLQN